jgi:hypothetical protein
MKTFKSVVLPAVGAPMKYVSVLVISLFIFNSVAFAAQITEGTSHIVKVKDQVQKRGIGEKSRVKAKLANGTEVKGYVSKIEETSFDVTEKTGHTVTIAYADVQKIRGPGLSKGAKIGIGVGVAVGGLAIIVAILYANAVATLGQ